MKITTTQYDVEDLHSYLSALIDACEKSGVLGLELRTQHAHKVEPNLTKDSAPM